MSYLTGFPKPAERAASLLHMEGMSPAASAGDMGRFSTRSTGCSFCHTGYPLF